MSGPKRRRWFSLSLRTLLIGMTLLSVLFAWFLHHRREKIAEKERLLKEYSDMTKGALGGIGFGPEVQLCFCDTLLGWEVPEPQFSGAFIGWVDDWAWLRPIAIPKLHSVYIGPNAQPASWDQVAALARRTPNVEFHGDSEWTRKFLPQLLSLQTDALVINTHFDELARSPNLRSLHCNLHSADEWEQILRHHSLRDLTVEVEPELLAHFPAGPHTAVRSLKIWFDWPDEIPEIDVGAYAWVQRFAQLQEVDTSYCDPAFLAAVGKQLGGVEKLILDGVDSLCLEQLASWPRLRHLEVDLNWSDPRPEAFDDRFLAALGRIPGDLQSLEIEGGVGPDDPIPFSNEAFANLKRFPHLKRLRLDACQLTKEHVAIIAELSELEELSLWDNPLNDEAIQPLHRLRRLRMINLDGTEVSDEQFKKIRGDWIQRPMAWSIIPVVGAW